MCQAINLAIDNFSLAITQERRGKQTESPKLAVFLYIQDTVLSIVQQLEFGDKHSTLQYSALYRYSSLFSWACPAWSNLVVGLGPFCSLES